MSAGHDLLPDPGVLPLPGAAATSLGMADRITEAILRNELSLVFQPQADVDTGRLSGFEALVRWRLADGTEIPPDLFVPVAEASDAIFVLGEWVLRRACSTAARWLRTGMADVPVAVNVSARQLAEPGLARCVLGILAETGLPASSLKLELTETALLDGSPAVTQCLLELRGAGVQAVLDDFGTGYSSLALLRRVPLEGVKIDRQFVQAMVDQRDSAAIVHAVVSLAHALGLRVVAEGVETRDQLLFLRAYGCDRIQGYLLSRPLAEADVPGFITATGAPPTAG